MLMSDMPLMGSPWPTLLIVFAYIAFVLKIGPAYMKTRAPYNLRRVLLCYNLLQVIANFYFGIEAFYIFFTEWPYDPGCMLQATPDSPKHVDEVRLVYAYFALKMLDLCDTIFFVLRKNFKQVSFLHVYHHILMALAVYWLCYSGNYGGHLSSTGMVNLIVHGFMYAYYFLSALSERVKRALWWKRYITLMQIAQFVLLIGHNLWPLIFRPDCQFPRKFLLVTILQGCIMLVLFGNFYYKAYMRKDTGKVANGGTGGTAATVATAKERSD